MLTYTHDIPGGAAWSLRLRAGRQATLTANGPNANVSTLIFGADLLDRLNLPDTLKAQMSARIKAPMVLMSDRGLALASVTSSTLDWHDALCGFTAAADIARFGDTSYQHDRNGWRRSARDLLLLELFKHGLGEADLHGCVNFFAKVVAVEDARCSLSFVSGHSSAGDRVTLRAEQDLLLVFATTPHPLDPGPTFAPAGVSIEVSVADAVTDDDPSMLFRPESGRALLETRKVLL
jgi:urea carboxylase-associated protein 2